MKRIFTLIFILINLAVNGQDFYNEWIEDYSKTYYKFKIATTGLYRISKASLDSAGLGNTAAEQFKLFRNGKEVPVYTSSASGVLPSDGFIEFWGESNDGVPDKLLYRDAQYQHSTKWSLQTDTCVYFLTVSTSPNLRLTNAVNDVAGNTLAAEPYFLYTYENHYRRKMNLGMAAVVGEYVYSSSYDQGEFFSSEDLWSGQVRREAVSNLFLYPSGGDPTMRYGAVGNAPNIRNLRLSVNNTIVKDTAMNLFNDLVTSVTFPITLLNSGTNFIDFRNVISQPASDRLVLSFFEITYPRQFNFGGSKNFNFQLPAKSSGYYLAITNFNRGTQDPVLYDLTGKQRYVGVVAGDTVKFVLPPSTTNMNLVLTNQETSNIRSAHSLVPKTFINFQNVANQGDYLIISNPLLYNGANGVNQVEEYRAYRASAPGGSYKAKIYDINELVDQFAFGIKKHPLSIKNFLRFARAKFAAQPKFVFLIGRGVEYVEYRSNESHALVEKLNLVPSFGYPASDNMLTSPDGFSSEILTPIGRLSVVSPTEIEDYLEKIKEYDANQQTAPNTIAGRLWMKNAIHVTGASDSYLGTVLCNYMEAYKQILTDTLIGASITVFCKNSTNPVEQLSSERISDLFEEGLSLVNYFGHSSSTTLEFNLDDPKNYNNAGKYPVFSVNGCNAGNFFTFDPQRFSYNETLSEKFVLAKQRGGIAFIANTHYGIVNYLNIYINSLYKNIAEKDFNISLGEINRNALQYLVSVTGETDYYSRAHAEEITLHGDPAIKLNFQALPDYVIEEPQVKISPAFISIAENSFKTDVKFFNLGRAVNDSITIDVKREYPDGSVASVFTKKIQGTHYSDSIQIDLPIISTRDKGRSRLIITLDADENVSEVDETNNKIIKEFYIYEDEAKPAFPYNYSIVSNPAQVLYASTANPMSTEKVYVMEMDTTLLFNSPLKVVKQITALGGIIEFNPGMSYIDSTVYYWRTSLVPGAGGDYRWSNSSFTYINGATSGFSQSHYYQHLESKTESITLNEDRKWQFGKRAHNLFVRSGMYPTSGLFDSDFTLAIDEETKIASACLGYSLLFNIIDPITFKPWKNVDENGNNLYRFGSASANCAVTRNYNFEFSYWGSAARKVIMDFMDSIPEGHFVVVRSFDYDYNQSFSPTWRADTALFGSNNSLYHKLLKEGFLEVDSINQPRTWSMIYKKGDPSFAAKAVYSQGIYDRIVLTTDALLPDTMGYIKSPNFGPAQEWKQLHWRGTSDDITPVDNPIVTVIGITPEGVETPLYSIDKNVQDLDLSSVNATSFPFIRLQMRNLDSINLTPFQLKSWTLDYIPVPEGALAPNLYFTSKDSLEVGELLNFGIGFKNISTTAFDSLKINVTVIDRNNVTHLLSLPRVKPLLIGDTLMFKYVIDTKDYGGLNTLYVEFNADKDQPEQNHYNNFIYRNFYVKPDNTNPLMDVTFDGVHILNRDIVSSKPHIKIKLTDEAKYMLMNDTSVIRSLEVVYPDENSTVRKFNFDNDTLRFIPAASSSDNTATIEFSPYFPQVIGSDGQPRNPEGDDYELIIKGNDRSGNKAGQTEYKVAFKVINKPMISNLFNYPNPFTTSTAFVFTITGSEIPQQLKIQILTVTGKVVREITKEELGPLNIGRNITEFKWDGTDQFGQRLANGVYLYRVVTSLNGKALDKYKIEGETSDRYFNRGYGKMYLMR